MKFLTPVSIKMEMTNEEKNALDIVTDMVHSIKAKMLDGDYTRACSKSKNIYLSYEDITVLCSNLLDLSWLETLDREEDN